MSVKAGERYYLPVFINQVDLLAGNAVEILVPQDLVVEGFRTTIQKAITTGGTLTIKKTVTTALDTQVGANALQQTIANSATKGTQQLTTQIDGDASLKLTAGQRVAVVPASFATAGEIIGHLICRTISLAPAL
jgi:hypothetical protein